MARLEFYDKHNMVAYLIKFEGSEGFHEIIDFLSRSHIKYALSESPTIYVSLIEQFWQNATLSTYEDGVQAITATIDGRDKTIIEASLRRHLKLEDAEGISALLHSLMKKYLSNWLGEASSTSPSRVSSSPSLQSHHTTSSTLATSPSIQTPHVAEEPASMPHESPLYSVHCDEGRLQPPKLMDLVTKLTDKIGALEKIAQIDTDSTISLVQDEGTSWFPEHEEVHEKTSADTEVLIKEETHTEIVEDLGNISTTIPEVSTADAALVYVKRSASKAKDKEKAIMTESEPPKKLKKKVQVQLSVDEELARKIQEEEQARAIAEQEQERINLEAALEFQRQLDKRQEVTAEPTQA
ncbi:hypothetical protein Tco_0697043 [Tanacetum coccineum]